MKTIFFIALSFFVLSLQTLAQDKPKRNPAGLGAFVTPIAETATNSFYQIKKDGITCFVVAGDGDRNHGTAIDCIQDKVSDKNLKSESP